jgi:hypothetical protein
MSDSDQMTIPRPIPAVLGLPDWFKALPAKTFLQCRVRLGIATG